MKRKELLREDIIKEKVKGGDCKTMPDTLYNILYEKSKVYGVRVLYEEDFPLDELTEFIQQEIDRAREEQFTKEELLVLEDALQYVEYPVNKKNYIELMEIQEKVEKLLTI